MGFTGGSTGKESACNAGDPNLIPGSGKIRWRRDRLPTPEFLGFSAAQPVKTQPTMRETWVQSLGCEDPLEEGMATHSSILGLENSMDRGTWQATVHRVEKSDATAATTRPRTLKVTW